MSGLGNKRSFRDPTGMSAPGGRADEISTKADVGLECRLFVSCLQAIGC